MKKDWLPSEEDIKNYELLVDMLIAQKNEYAILSKKKSEGQLNKTKIQMINRVLEPLKNILKNEPSHQFLDLILEADMPNNSDIVLIISQYETAIDQFRKKYYLQDDFQYDSWNHKILRWMTKEFPPDYYSSHDE